MRILVLHSDVAPGAPPDELDTLAQAKAVAAALEVNGHAAFCAAFAPDRSSLRTLIGLAKADAVFNLVESVWGRGSYAPLAAQMLDEIDVFFTGTRAGTMATTGDKLLTKRLLAGAGLPTPSWSEPPDWNEFTSGGRWIVKSADEDASVGLDDGSVVSTRAEATARAESCAARHGGRWFAERYIEGREFNVAVAEQDGRARVLPIAEMRFERWREDRPRIVGYAAKWDQSAADARNTVRDFGWSVREPDLCRALGHLSKECWSLFACRGYVRVDFRVDAAGSPFILEINPNPCLEPEAGFAAAAAHAGLSYVDLVDHILRAGIGATAADVPRHRASGGR